jgi:protein involved in sex pheromone biosynthesis
MFDSAPSPMRRTLVIAAVAAAFLFSACESMQGMKMETAAPQKSLYERLGG